MNEPVTIDSEFKSLIPPLTDEEYRQLEENCKRDGIQDSLKVWRGILIDGHNRYRISEEYDLNYRTEEIDFPNREAVIEWIINNQLGRRNITTITRIALVEQKPSVIKAKKEEARQRQGTRTDKLNIVQKSSRSRDEIAKLANTSHDTYSKGVVILNSGDSELIDSVKSGEISINQAYRTVKGIKSTSPQQAKKQFEKELHERRNDFSEKKQSGVVDFKSVQQEKEDRDYAVKSLWLDMLKMGAGIDGMYLKHKFKEIDIAEMAKHIKHEDLEDLIKTMKRWMSEVEQMIVIMEGQN